MTAQIINLRAWRLAHAQLPVAFDVAVQVWLWPLRLWLAWWGIR